MCRVYKSIVRYSSPVISAIVQLDNGCIINIYEYIRCSMKYSTLQFTFYDNSTKSKLISILLHYNKYLHIHCQQWRNYKYDFKRF